ncbi:MAG: hypothetical protein QN189_12065 [Armatimonadota bacterium]|nr:hypothetical protein [Armatimonadota bacterium]
MESVKEIIVTTQAAGGNSFVGILGQRVRYAAAWWRVVGIWLVRIPEGSHLMCYVLQEYLPVGRRKPSTK